MQGVYLAVGSLGGRARSKEISRRTFIKGAAAAGVVLAAGSYFTWNGHNIPEKVQQGNVTYDVLIIGSGGAGMRAALAAAENKELKVAVMTKLIPTRSASTMAQGGMNGVTGVTDPADSVESHVFDTVKGGDYLSDQEKSYRQRPCILPEKRV